MNENLQTTISAYLDDAFNDGVDTGRGKYKAEVIRSLNNMLHDLLTTGKANQAEALAEAIKRLEQLD